MCSKGAWRDNVFVERLWRTIKYEEVYLRAYASVSEARAGIGLQDIYRALWPFMLMQIAAMLLVLIFPEIALWLPRLLSSSG